MLEIKNRTNVRAIDIEEVLQLVTESNGIYETTLVNLLQCNRITLKSRLKTMLDNKLISRKKLNKSFYFDNKYEIKNLKSLDLQTHAVQHISRMLVNMNKVEILTNNNREKQILGSFFTFPRAISNSNQELKNLVDTYYNRVQHPTDKDLFLELSSSLMSKFIIKFSSLDEFSLRNYGTENYEYIEILAIEDKSQLDLVKHKLKDLTYINDIHSNNEFIREDILVYIKENDSLLYFTENYDYEYEEKKINNIFDIFYLIANHITAETPISFSEQISDMRKWNSLYEKSRKNKEKFTTLTLN